MTDDFYKKLADYLILNAYSLRNTGFYNGKAGIALCLFETARHLENADIEEHAFELLQESLVLGEQKNDLSFESGLPGIAFVLLYLIRNKFVDADFDELFGEHLPKITEGLKSVSDLVQYFSFLRFFSLLSQTPGKEEFAGFTANIRNAIETKWEQNVFEFTKVGSKLSRSQLIADFVLYLKINSMTDSPPSFHILKKYAEWYEEGKIAGRLEISFFLNRLHDKPEEDKEFFDRVSLQNETQALQELEINYKKLSLAGQLDLLYLLNRQPDQYGEYISLLEKNLFISSPEKFQSHLLKKIPGDKFIPGYLRIQIIMFSFVGFAVRCSYREFLGN